MPQPLVSVITCFYNEEHFLEEAIRSVLAQSYPHWELLLIDDGSTDASAEIAKNFVAGFPHQIFYLDHPMHANKGLSASRNLGIAQAKGSLVALLDADDVWMPGKLERQVAIMTENNSAGMLCEASVYWYSWFDKEKVDVVKQVGEVRDRLIEPPQLVGWLYPFGPGDAPCPSGIMVRKAALESVGGFESQFQGSLQLYEDQALLFKLYLSEAVYISSACNNKYRQRAGSIVNQVTKQGYYNQVRHYFLLWGQNYMIQMGIKDVKVESLVRQALFPYQYPRLHWVFFRMPAKCKKLVRKITRKFLKYNN